MKLPQPVQGLELVSEETHLCALQRNDFSRMETQIWAVLVSVLSPSKSIQCPALSIVVEERFVAYSDLSNINVPQSAKFGTE